MTALRPERESGTSYGQQPYGAPGVFEDWSSDAGGYGAVPEEPYGAGVYGAELSGTGASGAELSGGESYGAELYEPPVDDETVALRIPDPPPVPGADSISAAAPTGRRTGRGPAPGGRAARRKAAKRRRGRHWGAQQAAQAAMGAEAAESPQEPGRPLSRVEARRLARARKPSPGVVASRVVGEVFITTGVLMLLFVTYQLWWTNVRAHAQAGKEASSLQDDWANGKRSPGVFAPGQGFAILHIPKLDVVVPIAEGISNKGVLDRGMVGHYGEGALKTAMPDAKTGNFGLAGHRNTHGEPFRYINRLKPGDPIVVETQEKYFVYKMASMLPVTSPSNTSVLDPVPPGSGFTGPGRYITLTTCTPEFTSKYRLIVWGKMVEERPRSKGKPDALIS
ncbi:class E sortase [Streptomyces sp. TRM68367]|uniref:class E sortase n=1 Tax=Streptomyces sp. TRM68367 TaxID=2758415 RepID=UPI002934F70F|nr:class E sortase [Streptomyces sp. TRM68367]